MRTKRNREPEAPRPEPWNPEQWPEPEPELDLEPELDVDELADEPGAIPAPASEAPPVRAIPELPSLRRRESPYAIRRRPVDEDPDALTEQIPVTPAPLPETDRLDEGRLAGSAPDESARRRRLLIGGTVAAAVTVGAGVLGWSLLGGEPDPTPVAAPMTSATTSAAAPAPADADCPAGVKGNVITGRDPGDQNSGSGVIKAFDHAYYTERSGKAAHAFGTRTARIGKPEQMQTFIDKLPKGTTHCLRITDQGTGLYAVELSEIPPGGGEPEIYQQNVQTTQADGKYWIQSIDPVS